jgi:branched-chain amino acid transport system ATP-binding protein
MTEVIIKRSIARPALGAAVALALLLTLSIADRGYVLVHGDVALAGDAAQLHKDRHLLMASYLGEVGAEQAETDPEPTRQED